MITFINWFFQQVADFVRFLLSIKLIGDLSLFHFVLGGLLLMKILNVIFLAQDEAGHTLSLAFDKSYRSENAKDKRFFKNQNYNPKHNSLFYKPRHGKE